MSNYSLHEISLSHCVKIFIEWHFFTFCFKWRSVMVEHDLDLLCLCTITFSLIVWDKIGLHKTRESWTYLVFAIGRGASYPWLNYYAIVLQTTINIFSTMLVECYFLKDIDYKNVEEIKKVAWLIVIRSIFQGLRVLNSFNYPNWNTCSKIKP
jgi:hypothetical protein